MCAYVRTVSRQLALATKVNAYFSFTQYYTANKTKNYIY